MYPQPELNALNLRKRALMHRIRVRREACAVYAHEVLKPAEWASGVYAKWQAISPLTKLAAVPLGVLATRKLMPKIGGLLSWAPLALNVFRAFR